MSSNFLTEWALQWVRAFWFPLFWMTGLEAQPKEDETFALHR